MSWRAPRTSRLVALLPAALLALGIAILGGTAPTAGAEPDKEKKAEPKSKLGLQVNEAGACKGYTLIASSTSNHTYLIDMEGRVVNSWRSDCNPGLSAYLLEDGHLLRTGAVKNPPFFGGGTGGRIQEFDWDGKLVWDYTYTNENILPNHDICKLPNGNVLMIVWEKKSSKDAIAAGRRPETVSKDGYMLSGALLEVQPTGQTGGKIVWEWHAWDHVIQEFDDKQAHHGDVGAHPELIDLNFGDATIAAMVAKPEELEKLKAIGYVGGAGRKGGPPTTDWLHLNGVAYNPETDQIMLSAFEFSELWVLDHSTKADESAGHKGGKYGKGGDLLYRWGNPRAYRGGTVKDQKLFGQHNAHWIAKGLPGAGHVLIFNNGARRTGGAYSSVDEIVLPVNDKGQYELEKGKAFGPEKPIWSYAAEKKTDFYAPFISGAERLSNGNTLICSGTNGTIFEVTAKEEIVWKYVNPEKAGFGFGPPGGGGPGFGPAPKLGQMVSSFTTGFLKLSDDQKKDLTKAEKEMGEKLGKLLTDDQKKQFAERPGFGEIPLPGQLISAATQERLQLSEDQKKQLTDIQKEADDKLDSLLKDDQKKQLKEMKDRMKNFGGGRPGGPGGPPPGGGFPGFGAPGGGTGLFRAPRYAPDFPGLKDKELKPGKTIDEIGKDPPKKEESKDK